MFTFNAKKKSHLVYFENEGQAISPNCLMSTKLNYKATDLILHFIVMMMYIHNTFF